MIERIDAGKKSMEDAILEFGEKLKAGGVGFYPRDKFVHVDTGKLRYW